MKLHIEVRIINEGMFTVDNKSTVRATAKKFGVTKSTVFRDITEILPKISKSLAKEVKVVLQENKSQMHIRGGIATKQKWFKRNVKPQLYV